MKIVCNSSPLIFLAKLNKLNLFKSFSLLIPQEVHEELFSKECAEKDILTAFFKEKNVSIHSTTQQTIKSKSLGKGELAVINLALEHNIKSVILDDRRARTLARTTNLHTYGTLWILLTAYKDHQISKETTYQLICDLPLHGFRIDQEFFLQILKRLK